jgi:hypothetical protein
MGGLGSTPTTRQAALFLWGLVVDRIQWYEFGVVKAAEPEAAPWTIYIQASTPRVDYDNERIPQAALRQAVDYFLENGKITYEHLDGSNRHDASLIIGEPLAVEFPDDGTTMVQARLYPHQPQAQYVWNILQSRGKLKASVGGTCAKRPGPDGVTEIPRLFWNHLAITSFPVNNDTLVSLEPFAAFVKALGVSSAAPLVLEDLQGTRARRTPSLDQRWRALTAIVLQQFPHLTEDEARQVAALLLRRRGETREAYAPGVALLS